MMKEVLTCRFEQCRLKLNAEKTKIVQCPHQPERRLKAMKLPSTFSAILSNAASHGIESKASASRAFSPPSVRNR